MILGYTLNPTASAMADAVTLGKRFGADVESVEFWRSSLRVITAQIEEFEGLV